MACLVESQTVRNRGTIGGRERKNRGLRDSRKLAIGVREHWGLYGGL